MLAIVGGSRVTRLAARAPVLSAREAIIGTALVVLEGREASVFRLTTPVRRETE
jgi:hypothetical protein